MAAAYAVTRRTAIVGALTSSVALAVPVAAAVTKDNGEIERLIAAHRAALAAQDVARDAYCEVNQRTTLPDVAVAYGKSRSTGDIIYLRTETAINNAAETHAMVFGSKAADKKRQDLLSEMARQRKERRRVYVESGLAALADAREEAADAEFDAFKALITYCPQNFDQMRTKALYLVEYNKDDGYDRTGSWHADLLASFAGIEPVEVDHG